MELAVFRSSSSSHYLTTGQLKIAANRSEKLKQSEVLKAGQFVEMEQLPKCDFGCGKDAKFDSVCNINMHSWANMCSAHYRQYGIARLGAGLGQKLLLKK